MFGVSAFAYTGVSDYAYTTEKDVFLDAVNLIEAYSNGEISFDDFSSDLVYVQGKAFTSGLDVAAVKIQQFIDVCNLKFGSDSSFGGSEHGGGGVSGSRTPITDIWNDICNKNNVPTGTVQSSTTDMQGFGALAVRQDFVTGQFYYYYCDYISLDNVNQFKVFGFSKYSNSVDGVIGEYDPPRDNIYAYAGANWKFYGDVRYPDDTPAPSDDEFEYITIRKFDEMDNNEIVDLLKDISEKLEQEYPDLKSIEGLLRAIYARLGNLDSDNDNQLLSEILTAIKAIKSTDTDNTELLELLEDIKNALVFGDDENKETFSEQLKKLIDNQITRDDFVIDEDLYNNHGEILKERLLGKFSFVYNMKTFVEYCFDEYSNTSESPELEITYNGKSHSINFGAFDEYLPTIQWILAAFTYLTYAYHTYRKIPSYINGGDNE